MALPLVVRSTASAAAALAVLQLSFFANWSVRARSLLLLLASYLPSYLDGAEYKVAPRRSRGITLLLRRVAQQVLPRVFNLGPAKVEEPEKLASCRQYILTVHPHGVLSLGHYLTVLGLDRSLEAAAPQARRSALAAGVLFKIPVLRELSLWLGCVDAGRATASRCLVSGLSLSVVPGGEREQLLSQRGPLECLILKRRQGFVRLALQYGIPLVPVYCFGEAQLYHQASILMGFRSWLQRTFGFALVLPYGPYFIPGCPFAAPFRTVVGAPVEMPRLPQATREEVDEHHQRYMAAVTALFERHKEAATYGGVALELL